MQGVALGDDDGVRVYHRSMIDATGKCVMRS
jgi:hypothetical protein